MEVTVQRSQGLNRKEMHISTVPLKGHLIRGYTVRQHLKEVTKFRTVPLKQ